MKILYKGTPPGDRIWSGVCRNCHTMAEASESELTNIEYPRGPRADEHFSVEICPVCTTKNLVFCLKKPKTPLGGASSVG